jgi:Fe-S cluster assembly ATP-binding protein
MKQPELVIKNLHVEVEGVKLLHQVSLSVQKGEIVALMGPNGSGKTTLAHTIMGNPAYKVTSGDLLWKGKSILPLGPDVRSRQGIFLSFQHPFAVPGVSLANMLRIAYNARQKKPVGVLEFHKILDERMQFLQMDPSFKNRAVNDGFSGGEKKRSEILQLAVLEPELALLDETDSGTDIDALQIISEGIAQLKKKTGMGVLLITHYERIFRYLTPDKVIVMMNGRVVREGGIALAREIEKKGFKDISSAVDLNRRNTP